MKLLDDVGEAFFPANRREAREMMLRPKILYFEDYFPSEIMRVANRLVRKGVVTKFETPEGILIKISDAGKKELLKYDLENLGPKTGEWDGKWRMVFFDIEEKNRKKRNQLTMYLRMLGMKEMQKSIYISPFDVSSEVKYLREILNVSDEVKYGVLEFIENGEDLKEIFKVK